MAAATALDTVIALMRTADLVRRHTTALCEPHDLTLQQFNVWLIEAYRRAAQASSR